MKISWQHFLIAIFYFLYYFSLHTIWTRCFFFFFFFFFFLLVFSPPPTYPTPFLYLPSFSFSSFIPDYFFSSRSLSYSLALSLFTFSISTSIFFPLQLTSHTHTQPTWPSSIFYFLFFILSCSDSLCCYNGAQIGFHALDLLFLF